MIFGYELIVRRENVVTISMDFSQKNIKLYKGKIHTVRHLPQILLFFMFPVFLSFCAPSQVNAQKWWNDMEFLTGKDGLVNNRVTRIYRDTKGFVWIGTDGGLSRYNGLHFTNYLADTVPGTLCANWITCIGEDKYGNVWIGTENGLNRYNPAFDNFDSFVHTPSDSTSIASNIIKAFYLDHDSVFWIATIKGGLNRLNYSKNSFVSFINPEVKFGDSFTAMLEDYRGNFWVVSEGRGISLFNKENGEFKVFDDPHINFADNSFKSLYVDKGQIWISSLGNGIVSFNLQTHEFVQYSWNGDGTGTNRNRVYNAIEDGPDHLVFAVDQGGINRLDKRTGEFSYILFDNIRKGGINNNGIRSIFKDQEGIIWLSTSGGGVNYYNPQKNKFNAHTFDHTPNSLSYSVVGCFHEDSNGEIWIGTDGGGISVYNKEKDQFRHYIHKPDDPYSIGGNVIRKIVEDKEENIWIATWASGLNKYNRKTKSFTRPYPLKKDSTKTYGQYLWTVGVDHNDILWVSVFRKGVILIDKRKGIINRFEYEEGNPKSLSDNIVWEFFEDENNIMWLITPKGICQFDSISNSFIRFDNFSNNKIRGFCITQKGEKWGGSFGNGIFKFDKSGNVTDYFTEREGLSSNLVQSLVEDNNGILWIATNNGISSYNPLNKNYRKYSVKDGLPGNDFFPQAYMKDRNGKIYFGGFNGFIAFQPDSLVDNDYIPYVFIDDFKIFNKSVAIGTKNSPLKKHIAHTKSITLSHKQSTLSFSLRAINMTFAENNQFAYTMDGFEDNWNYTDARHSEIIYRNIKPGEYVFKVKGSNNDGIWNDKPVHLQITIIPPWWQTTHFYIISSVSLLLMITYIIRRRIRKLRHSNIILAEKVEIRTRQLKEKNIKLNEQKDKMIQQAMDLKKINTQLKERQNEIEQQSKEIITQRDLLMELNSTKDLLFSIIAHDLRSPFNTILNSCYLLSESRQILTEHEIDKIINTLNKTTKITFDLLEKLLKWSMTQQGIIKFEPQSQDLVLFVKEEIEILKQQALQKEIEIELAIEGTPKNVLFDADLIGTVFRNLISNAIKFSNLKGKVLVKVQFKNEKIQCSVKDFGVGMSPEQLEKLFVISNNATTVGTAGERGTGLGLLLALEFIKIHKGKIWAESELTKGTCINFFIPLLYH